MEGEHSIFWTGSEIVAHTLPIVGFWVEHLVPKRGIVLLHGKYGSYKTPLSIHLAYCVASGIDFLGFGVEQTRVLYVEGDTPMIGIWPRLQSMNPNSPNLDFAFVYPGINVVQPTLGDYNKEVCSALAARHKDSAYGLVVVDSLRTSHLMGGKDDEVPTMVYGSFARLFPGATILVIHHDRKSKIPDGRPQQRSVEIDNESFSGSQAWIDRATTSIKLTKGYGADKQFITITQTKSQVGEEIEPLHIKVLNGHSFSPVSDLTDAEITAALLTFNLSDYKTRSALDKQLAGYFGVTLRWATTRRTAYESSVQKLF